MLTTHLQVDGFGEVFPPLPPSLLVATKPKNRRRVSVSAFGSVPIALLARNKHHLVDTIATNSNRGARRVRVCALTIREALRCSRGVERTPESRGARARLRAGTGVACPYG